MQDEQKSVSRFSRRDFLKNSAVVGAGVVGASALSACASNAPSPTAGSGSFASSITWDYEVDLVIVGCGGAGITAALTAQRAGASFLVLEKDDVWRGGNTGCTGTFTIGQTEEAGFNYFKALCWGTTPDEVLRSHVAAFFKFPEFVKEVLGRDEIFYEEGRGGIYPTVPGGPEFAGPQHQWTITGTELNVNETWGLFKEAAIGLGISPEDGNVMLATPATNLIQDPTTKEVIGVKAMTGVSFEKPSFEFTGGTAINVKANKAVILACGGYENNTEMLHNFAPHAHGAFVTFYGTPYNKGDGVRMCQELGAKLWHLNKKEAHAFSHAQASKDCGCGVVMREAYGPKAEEMKSCIFVNRYGRRFMNESFHSGHTDRSQPWDTFVHQIQPGDTPREDYADYPNNPWYWIFDQTIFESGSLLDSRHGGQPWRFAPVNGLITWSDDNQAEVDKGWILKGDTPEQLAEQIVSVDYFGREEKMDSAALAETIRNYNSYCETGTDPEFDRYSETMAPLNNGPYYAMELIECQTNTDGGPERNEFCQTIDVNNQVIPRLYTTGELGSIWGFLYNGGGNIPETYCTGIMAAEHALALEPLA